jgi:16S rRNA (uracil1498-N3)-methyltransferase
MTPALPRCAGTRLYCDVALAPGAEIALPEAAARHAVTVLRLQVGDTLNLFNGSGGEYSARLVAVSKREARVRLIEFLASERESPVTITLALGISAGERMDYSLQKATELGVAAIQPLATERSVVRLAGERADKRLAHWQHVVTAACEQCGRNRVPAIEACGDLRAGLNLAASNAPGVVLQPDAAESLGDLARAAASSIAVAVGPEGGFDPAELELAARAGYRPVRLGPRVLRTETAGLAALSTLQSIVGDFR